MSSATDRPGARRRAIRVLPLIAPAVLVAVALLQIWRAHTLDQSSWAGAGFGMFATFENEQTRTVRITVVSEDGASRPLDPRGAGDLVLRAKEVPTGAHLEALARWAARQAPDASGIIVQVDGIDVAVTGSGADRRVEVTTTILESVRWEP